jgi:hypothetical protein
MPSIRAIGFEAQFALSQSLPDASFQDGLARGFSDGSETSINLFQ